jgi:hypothetical protein
MSSSSASALAPGGVCTAIGYYLASGTRVPLMRMYATDATLRVGVSHARCPSRAAGLRPAYRVSRRTGDDADGRLGGRPHCLQGQDDAIHPRTRPWHGDWEIAVITATGRGPAGRAELRAVYTDYQREATEVARAG